MLKPTRKILAIEPSWAPAFLCGDDLNADMEAREGAEAPEIGTVAVLPIMGGLRNRSSYWSSGGSMSAIRDNLQRLGGDNRVKAIVLDIDSPGGTVGGTPETAEVVRQVAKVKPVFAAVNTMAASAAYWIGSQATKMFMAPSAKVGSIGVFAAHTDFSAMDEAMGVKTTLIHAGKFKVEGNPYEPLTDEAREQIQAEVDEAYDLFTSDVAKGRGVSVSVVRKDFGEGRIVGAVDAVKRGMADGIAPIEQVIAQAMKEAGASSKRVRRFF